MADHNGAHVAFGLANVDREEARNSLPGVLATHRVDETQSVEVEEADDKNEKDHIDMSAAILEFSDPKVVK